MQTWKIIESEYLIRSRWLTVRADNCERPDGLRIDPYYVLEYSDWVHVVALDADDHVLITLQYRHAIGKVCAELPGGIVEPNEAPLATARRELREETGCTAERFLPLPKLHPNPATHTNRFHCFLATGVVIDSEPTLDETEEITFEFLTVSKVFELINTGEFSQGLHVASLMLGLKKRGLLKITTA